MKNTKGYSSPTPSKGSAAYWTAFRQMFAQTPLLGWIFGILIASGLERLVGLPLARAIGLSKPPVLFGVDIALKTPQLLPASLLYDLVIYLIPVFWWRVFLTR
jgi:hypothetical protein